MASTHARSTYADWNPSFISLRTLDEFDGEKLTHDTVKEKMIVSHIRADVLAAGPDSGAAQVGSAADTLTRPHSVSVSGPDFRSDYSGDHIALERSDAVAADPSPVRLAITTEVGSSTAGSGGSSTSSASLAASSVTTSASTTIIVPLGTTAAQLQHLIDTSPPGAVLQLQAGHYNFNQTITIDRDDISVVGAGSDKTFIDVPSSLGQEAFNVGDGDMSGSYTLKSDVAEGSTVLTLTSPHSFEVGDYVYLSRESTEAYYDEIGDDVWRNTDVPLQTSIVQVTAVDGQTITVDPGVHFDFTTGETVVSEISMVEDVTLGGFTVDYGLGEADPSDFSNTMSSYDRNAVIEVDGTAGLTLFDIASHDVPSIGVNVAASTDLNADSITMTGAHNKGDGGNGYGLQIRDVYDSSFTNISDADMRHSVVFSSWQSSVGNFVHVSTTDRDINFHGSPDHENVVMVDESIRDANSDIISPTLFINTQGTSYGSVTDADANVIEFGHVVGTRLSDDVTGYDNGAWLEGAGGDDTLTGGAGNDLLKGGAGKDVLVGGGGEDIAEYDGKRSAFLITDKGYGSFDVKDTAGTQSIDTVSETEWLLFDDGALRLSDMKFTSTSAVDSVFAGPGTYNPAGTITPAPIIMVGTSGKDVFDVSVAGTIIQGLGEWDVVRSTVSFTMADDVERLDLLGTSAIDGTGGGTASQIYGNDARNVINGMAGNDKLWGRLGDDSVQGGDGADLLYGDAGNDRLDGGAGQDKLTGGAGADVFVFRSASDTSRTKSDKVIDFQSGVDKINLSDIDANTALSGNQAFVWRSADTGAASLWFKSGYLYGDLDANGVADLAIYLGSATLMPTDILL